jgi:hypothetical protein
METKDVWLLLAGAVLGYVINLMATFTAPSVGTAFGKLKSGPHPSVPMIMRHLSPKSLASGRRIEITWLCQSKT